MDENRLEKHMRDKLSRYESLSDADAMWNAIQAKQNALEEKPKRRFPFYLVILVTAGIIIGGTMYIQFYDSSSDIAQNENASKSPNTKTETIISENIIQESKNQIIENSSISEEFNETLKGSDKSSQITSAKKLSNETITNISVWRTTRST